MVDHTGASSSVVSHHMGSKTRNIKFQSLTFSKNCSGNWWECEKNWKATVHCEEICVRVFSSFPLLFAH